MIPILTQYLADIQIWIDSWSPVEVGRLIFYAYLTTFVSLFLTATVGFRLGFRKKYISTLDRIFQFAALSLSSNYSDEVETEEEKYEDEKEK